MKTALLAGSTGLTGRCTLDILLKDEVYDKVIIPVRKISGIENTKLHQVEVNFDKLTDFKSELKADDVFCCLGTTMKKAGSKEEFYKVDHNYVYDLAKICLSNGAKIFSLISSIGADKNSGNFYLKVKGETEEDVIDLGFETTNIFRPSFLIGERKETRTGESAGIFLMRIIDPLMLGPLKKYKTVDAKIVAEVMVNEAQRRINSVNIFSSDMIHKLYTEYIL